MFSTLTSKGQLTVPKKIREWLGLQTGDRIHFMVNEAGKVELAAVKTSLKDLKGVLQPPDKDISLEDMEVAIREQGGSVAEIRR